MTEIKLKVIFPITSTVPSSTFTMDSSTPVRKAIVQMLETAKLPKEEGKYGLLIPEKNLWLTDTAPLSRYAEDIASAESILLKEKEATWNPQQIALYAGLGIDLVAVLGIAALVYVRTYKS